MSAADDCSDTHACVAAIVFSRLDGPHDVQTARVSRPLPTVLINILLALIYS